MSETESAADATSDEKIRKMLRVHDDEEILLTRRPSLFAFMPAYFVGLCVLGLHLLFGWLEMPDEPVWWEYIVYGFVEVSTWLGGAGFAFVMLFFTWLNRLINHPASGRWMTTILLLASLTPLLLHMDTIINLFAEKDYEIPISFNFTIFGILWAVVIWGVTFWFQKSFLYAVTSERIIHHQDFIYERDGLRLLHEDIIAVHKLRSPVGALFGYATIYCNIGDQSHISTETVGGGVAVPAEAVARTGFFGFLSKVFFLFTYQRTVKTERFTPSISLYGVRKWEEAYDLINRLHRENSAASKADEQLKALQNIQDMLGDQGEDEVALDEVDELLEDL